MSKKTTPIAEGSFGQVYLYNLGKKKLAVKTFRDESEYKIEEEIINIIKDKNCSLVPAKFWDEKNSIVMPFMKTAYEYKNCQEDSAFAAQRVIYDMARILICLRDEGLCYLDIKPENILVAGNKVYLGDLGSVMKFAEFGEETIFDILYLPPHVMNANQNQRITYIKKYGLETLQVYALLMTYFALVEVNIRYEIWQAAQKKIAIRDKSIYTLLLEQTISIFNIYNQSLESGEMPLEYKNVTGNIIRKFLKLFNDDQLGREFKDKDKPTLEDFVSQADKPKLAKQVTLRF